MSYKLALVGYGKIARDQHMPAIAANPNFELVAIADPVARSEHLPSYKDVESLLAHEAVDGIVMCQPPQTRYAAAQIALEAGKHVLLEKPPALTVAEVEQLHALAQVRGVSLFTAWHSRYGAGAAAAKAWVAAHPPTHIAIHWKEDVRHWHPGQEWLWQHGGFGVFDPGINAFSLLCEIIGEDVRMESAALETPSNRQMPIAATLALSTSRAVPIEVAFDFLQMGEQTWDIIFGAGAEQLVLQQGGHKLLCNGAPLSCAPRDEYASLYTRFAELLSTGESEVITAPLQLVQDALAHGSNTEVEPFHYAVMD
jgi:D-galactose 1-dehydrogenase